MASARLASERPKEMERVSLPVLLTQCAHGGVVGLAQLGPKRLVAAVDDDEQWLALAFGFVVEEAEEPVMAPAWAVFPDLEPSGHVAVHRLPRATPGEPFRRSRGDGVEYGVELGAHAGWAHLAKEFPPWRCLGGSSSGWRLKYTMACASSEDGPFRT